MLVKKALLIFLLFYASGRAKTRFTEPPPTKISVLTVRFAKCTLRKWAISAATSCRKKSKQLPSPQTWVRLRIFEPLIPNNRFIAHSYSPSGNVSHVVPSFHGVFGIPTPPNIPGHHPEFANAAKEDEAHKEAILCGKGLAMLGFRILTEPGVADSIRRDLQKDDTQTMT